MRVAIAGPGNVGRYLVEELTSAGIEVVVLTRSHKAFLDGKAGVVEQRLTDYSSATELAQQIEDCDALLSTIQDQGELYGTLHLLLFEACKLSPKCKRFIPCEYTANTEDVPEYKHESYEKVKDTLKAQSEIEWTVILNGLFLDYFVPASMRYFPDIGPFIPLDLTSKTLTIPGTGKERIATTSARDSAKAVVALLQSTAKWNHYTFLQGEETSWLEVAETMKTVGGMPDLKVEFQSVEELQAIAAQGPSLVAFAADFKLKTLNAMSFDQAKVARDRTAFFSGIHFRTIQDALAFVKTQPNTIF